LDNRTRQREHSAVGGGIDGMLAEYALLEEDGIVKASRALVAGGGATPPCAGVTVWNAMMEHAKLIAGQTVLLQGTGGVSIFGLQLARTMGIQVIITSSSDDKLARAEGTRCQSRHQLQDYTRLAEGCAGVHRRPWR
jgi:NADPH:quinone reductase-like Zn-dependent oxidoreductase